MLTYFLVYYFVGMFILFSLTIIGASYDKVAAKEVANNFLAFLIFMLSVSFVWPLYLLRLVFLVASK